jgi:ABC-type glycerol-3-phosphate transport system permease component
MFFPILWTVLTGFKTEANAVALGGIACTPHRPFYAQPYFEVWSTGLIAS